MAQYSPTGWIQLQTTANSTAMLTDTKLYWPPVGTPPPLFREEEEGPLHWLDRRVNEITEKAFS